jgi:hypothetical protein
MLQGYYQSEKDRAEREREEADRWGRERELRIEEIKKRQLSEYKKGIQRQRESNKKERDEAADRIRADELKVNTMMREQENLVSVFPRIEEIPEHVKRKTFLGQATVYRADLEGLIRAKQESQKALVLNDRRLESIQHEMMSQHF